MRLTTGCDPTTPERPCGWAILGWLHLDGMTHDEVAREVGLSVSGVRKRLRSLQGRVARKHPELAA